MSLDQLFDLFLREKRLLNNTSPRTIRYFHWCFSSYKRVGNADDLPTKQTLNAWIILLRESGITIFTINSYIRGINSFLS